MVVSFIVPMYGVAPYIERCARSLFLQTFESCEFIFVDDCSTDGSSETLMELVSHEFSHFKDRITLVRHASNLGVSEARNTALKIAKGKFVIFVDGDDCLDPDLAEELVIEQLTNNADIIFSNYYCASKEKNRVCRVPKFGGRKGTLNILASQSFAVPNRIWGVLIRRSLIVDNNLEFDPRLSIGEDFLFLTQLLYFSRSIAHVAAPLYSYYLDNEASAMQDLSRSKQVSYIRAVQQVDRFLNSREDGDSFYITRRLLHRNLLKWLILRGGHKFSPKALFVRCYTLILNSLWWLRWQLLP